MKQPRNWLAGLVRLPDWQDRLDRLVRISRHREFEWGAFDCSVFAADDVVALTGFDPFLPWRRRYADIAGAAAAIEAAAPDLESFARRHLAWLGVPEQRPLQAADGDIGCWRGPRSAVLGVYLQRFLAVPQARGLAFIPRAEAAAAWRIG